MNNVTQITKNLYYLGGNDRRIVLFESAYPVPRGMAYNSYLLKDEKTVLFDTVDAAIADEFLDNLKAALGGRKLDYLVVHHMEPDHSATFLRVVETYPDVTVLTSRKAAVMLGDFFPYDGKNVQIVQEGEAISVGAHTLKFVFAPMVHWPEVMMTYIPEAGILFSADAFGTFGANEGSIFGDSLDFERDFLGEARRYYFNIVGKYGVQVQNVLKKAAGLTIKLVCPLHGPVWRKPKDIARIVKTYDGWSKYEPEKKGAVVFYSSVYGHTQNAAEIVASELARRGINAPLYDVSAIHVSDLVAEAFRYSHAVFATTTYNAGMFVSMENFLRDLKAHAYQKRSFSLIENGSWAPQAGACMQQVLSECKDLREVGEKVTVLSSVKEDTAEKLKALAAQIAEDVQNG